MAALLTQTDTAIAAVQTLSHIHTKTDTKTSTTWDEIQSALTTIFDVLADSDASTDHRRQLCCDLLALDIVVQLLWIAQRVDRSAAENFKAIGPDEEVRVADEAIVILSLLAAAGSACPRIAGEPLWMSELLEESLEGIIHLTVLPDSSLLWPVNIIAVDDGCTVMDVVETASDGAMHCMRHLIIGTWRGPNQFRETEVDMSLPPGAQLDSFYTCTLAAVAATHTHSMQSDRPPRILVIGLGGGSLVAFLHRHLHADVESVELSAAVVRLAARCFGIGIENHEADDNKNNIAAGKVNLPGSQPPLPNIEELSGEVNLSKQRRKRVRGRRPRRATQLHDDAPLPLTRVHVADALEFLPACEPDSFDFVIVDTYTAEAFPPALMCTTFFDAINRVLVSGGGCAVNAGYGKDEKTVLDLMNLSFGGANKVDILVEQDAVMEDDRDYENAVLYGNNVSSLTLMPPLLPFILDGISTSVTASGNSVHSLFWKQAPNAAALVRAEDVCKTDKDAPVWDLFD